MNRNFVGEVLGPLSSHPRWVRWRRPRLTMMAAVAVGLFLVVTTVATFLLVRPAMSWLDVSVTYLVVALVAAVASAAATLAVCTFLAWRQFLDFQQQRQGNASSSPVAAIVDEEAPAVAEIDTPPDWLSALARELRQAIEPENIRPADGASSPPASRGELQSAFGFLPTEDQVGVLTRFQELYRDAMESDADACCDLLVEGAPGTGKSSALFACAVMAAFVRGQRVLLIVPDEFRQQIACARLQSFLQRLDLNYYVSVAPLSTTAVAHWLDGTQSVPQIIVASLDAVERRLYGYECPPQQRDALRRLSLLWEVVLVDDLLNFDDAARLHLPFLLDKHRLLLAAEMLPLQCVVTCGRLSEMGRRVVAERLITLRHAQQNQHWIRLRPPHGVSAWRVRWETDDAMEAMDKICGWLVEKGRSVVVYRPELDAGGRKALGERLAAGGEGRVVVLGELEACDHESSPQSVDAIVYEQQRDDMALALRMHAGHAGSVIFCLTPQGEAPLADEGVVPVLASRYATRMAAAHLGSVSRVMRPLTPVALALWHRLGIDPQQVPLADGDAQADMTWLVDQYNADQHDSSIWPFISLESTAVTARPVSTHTLPAVTHLLCATPARDHLILAKRQAACDSATASRRARWYDGLTPLEEVGDVDLAHVVQFKLRFGRLRLGVSALDRDSAGLVRLMGRAWQGGGADRCQGVYDVDLTLGDGLEAGGFWGGADDHLRWFRLEGDAMHVDARIIGLTSEDGQTSDIQPVAFGFQPDVSGLILHPMNIKFDELAEMHQRRLKANWSTGDRRFWGSLCGAASYALRVRAPGSEQFVRVLGYELTADQGRLGAAVLWFIEPAGSGRTASQLLEEILRDRAERKSFFAAAAWFLRHAPDDSDEFRRYFRRHAGLGLADDDRPGNASGALRLISPLLGTSSH